MQLSGALTALVTPFRNGALDEDAYRALEEAALENKKKPGNPLSKYERRKELTRQEQLNTKWNYLNGN